VLSIPGPVGPELYGVDADRLVYPMSGGFPGVDISLLGSPDRYDPPLMTGHELAERIGCLLAESMDQNAHEVLVFLEGYIAVRATPVKQAAVRAILGFHQGRSRALVAAHAQVFRIKDGFLHLVGKVHLRK